MINIGDHYNLWVRLLSLNLQTQKHMHAYTLHGHI